MIIINFDSVEQVRPHLELTFDNILAHINTVYVLNTKPGIMNGDPNDGCSISLRLKVNNNRRTWSFEHTAHVPHAFVFGSDLNIMTPRDGNHGFFFFYTVNRARCCTCRKRTSCCFCVIRVSWTWTIWPS